MPVTTMMVGTLLVSVPISTNLLRDHPFARMPWRQRVPARLLSDCSVLFCSVLFVAWRGVAWRGVAWRGVAGDAVPE
ncbi:hypothetical protein EHW64_18560 [Erwinia psidii]|uniref:hypothetical protein n=1 Tax=Erwinia psidii TaxID=69224 RepID=UPI00226B8EF6|nr:hypothetical protein [Erwinia psidii]MCX8963060.1 hypothetical protein [Erwinia psidii]